jgi:anti-sigma B factor antagonist
LARKETGREKNNLSQTPFEVESVREQDRARLTLSGELDMATAPRVEAAVNATLTEEVRTLTIDLSRLRFVDSSGLRLLIVLDRRARAEAWTLRLIRPVEQVLKVFRVSGLEENLPFVEVPSAR